MSDKFNDLEVAGLLIGLTAGIVKQKEKEYVALQTAKFRSNLNKLEQKIKEMERNTPMTSKEQFQTELDKLNLPDNLKAAAFTILDIGLSKLNRLPIKVIQEDKISIKLEYYDSLNSIMYVEGNIYGKYKYCDLESGLGELELEECFSNRANLKLVQRLQSLESHVEYLEKERQELGDKWRKLHSYLNSILELDCEDGCITDDDELILAVKEKLAFEKGMK